MPFVVVRKFILIIFCTIGFSYTLTGQGFQFTMPDSICTDDTLPIINTTNANNHHWSFCNKQSITTIPTIPTAVNTNHFNGQLNTSVFTTPVFDGSNYYLFITNYSNNSLTRVKYGNSYLNTPTSTNLGNFSNQLPSRIEGVQIKKENNLWYGFVVGTNSLIRLDFGTSLDNTPTLTDLGNIGSLSWPHELYIFNYNGNWYGFAANRNTSSVTRLSFGNSLLNTPTGNTISSIGLNGGASGLELEQDKNGDFYLFVTSLFGIVSRVKLGQDIMNTSYTYTAANNNNLSGTLRGLIILKDCDNYIGYACTESQKLVKIEFPFGIAGTMLFTSLGNMNGTIHKANDISNAIIEGDNAYAFVTNTDNTIVRLEFPFCAGGTNQFPPSSSSIPPPISYADTGHNPIFYTINFDDANQKDTCLSIYSEDCCLTGLEIKGRRFMCKGDSAQLVVTADTIPDKIIWYVNNTEMPQHKDKDSIWVYGEGHYKVAATQGKCTQYDSIDVNHYKYELNIAGDTILCRDDSISIHIEYNSTPNEITWYLNATPLPQHKNKDTIWATTDGVYSVGVRFDTCVISRSSTLHYNYNQYSLTGDTVICENDSTLLAVQYDSIPDAIDWFVDGSPIATAKNQNNLWAKTDGVYGAVANYGGCLASSSLTLKYFSIQLSITGDTLVCTGDSTLLSANKNYSSYTWSNGSQQKSTYALQAGTYGLQVITQQGCTLTDSIRITQISPNTINLPSDTLVCYLDFPFQYTVDDTCAFCSYQWSNNNTGKTLTAADSGQYILTVNSSVCPTLNSTVHIRKYDCSECFIHIPNAFTPDRNSFNDSFTVTYDCRIIKWNMKIFDRWGELIISIDDPSIGWDGYYKGEKAPEGVYLYVIDYIGGRKREGKSGTFHLLYLNKK